jgi:hypothetical protein
MRCFCAECLVVAMIARKGDVSFNLLQASQATLSIRWRDQSTREVGGRVPDGARLGAGADQHDRGAAAGLDALTGETLVR